MKFIFLLFLYKTKTSFIRPIFEKIDSNFTSYFKYIQLSALLFIGVLVALLGIKYMSFSFAILITMMTEVFFNEAFKFVQTSIEEKKNVLKIIPYEWFESTIKFIEDNAVYAFLVVLLVSIVLGIFITSLIQTFQIIGFIIVGIFLWKEDYINKILFQFGIDNVYIGYAVFVILLAILFYAFRIGPLFVVAGFFSLAGPLIVVISIEKIMKIDLGFEKTLYEIKENNTFAANTPYFVAFFCTCLVCFALQAYFVFQKVGGVRGGRNTLKNKNKEEI